MMPGMVGQVLKNDMFAKLAVLIVAVCLSALSLWFSVGSASAIRTGVWLIV